MLATGTEIGGYRIEGVLGRGGMGVVYEATQLSLSRTVALKLLTTELGEDQAFRDRFRREARMQARIDHTHIVTVYEAGEFEDGLFIAMRLIRGANLKQLIRSGEMTPERSLQILFAVADALDTAHESGLIHRDVKPQNILVGRRDHAFLADFGLTKAPGDTGFTRTGQLMGTLDYVSPEQIRGEEATSSSDVYALAGVAYECLVGTPPFARPSEAAVLYAHVAEPPPNITASRPDLPTAVDEVVARGLAKSPAERFSGALALMEALDRALATREQGGRNGVAPPVPVDDDETGESTEQLDRAPAAPPEPAPPDEDETGESTLQLDRTPVAPPEPEPEREPEPLRSATLGTGDTEAVAAAGSPTISDLRHGAPPPPSEEPEAPTKPQRSRARTPRPRRRAAAVVTAAAAAVAVAGYLAGDATTPEEATGPSTVASEDLEIRAPSGWKSASAPPEVPGLPLVRTAAVSPSSGGGSVVFGISDGAGPTLLPASLRDRLEDEPKPDATVRLGAGELEAYRYDALDPKDAGAPMRVYVTPTTSGVATVACVDGVTEAACDAVAGSLEAKSSLRPVGLGPTAAYARAVSPVLKRLRRERSSAQRSLAAAKRPESQADAAGRVSSAYATAVGALREIDATPLESEVHPIMVSALQRGVKAYDQLGAAARKKQRSRYATARDTARRADDRAERAVAKLESLGYTAA